MGVPVYENLKGFISNRPPLVVFMVCLGLFALVLLTLAYYVKVHEIRNPDITQDWNVFLENFAELEFCITGNNSDAGLTTTAAPATTTQMPKDGSKETSSGLPDGTTVSQVLEYEGPRNYSVSMLLSITPTREFLNIHHNVTHLSGTIFGHQLGLKGPAADEMINVTAELPYEWNTTQCHYPYGCDRVKIFTCVHFTASPTVFPTSRSPPMCEGLNETGVEYSARMMAHKPKPMFTTYYCRSRPVIKIHYKFNPTLTVWLSLRDRSVINLHLMHTSYFLFVMVVTLFCYAIIRGKPLKSKLTQTEKVCPLIPSQKKTLGAVRHRPGKRDVMVCEMEHLIPEELENVKPEELTVI